MARGTYSISTPQDDARLAKLLYEFIHGDPVGFPSDEEVTSMGLSLQGITDQGSVIKDEDWAAICDEEADEKQFELVVALTDAGEVIEASPGFRCTDIVLSQGPGADGGLSQEAKAFIEQSPEDATPEEILNSGQSAGVLPDYLTSHGIADYLASMGRHIMTEDEKAFLMTQLAVNDDGSYSLPSKQVVTGIIQLGKTAGTLANSVTYEGVRSHFRKVIKKLKSKQKGAGATSSMGTEKGIDVD